MSSQPKPNYQAARRSRWRTVVKMLLSDPWRKLIALLLAAGCWYALNHSLQRNTDNQRWDVLENLPVAFNPQAARQNGNDYYFDERSIAPQEVTLSVASEVWNEALPTARDFKIRIHPEGLNFTNDGVRTQPLKGTYTLTEKDLPEKPAGFTLRYFSPAAVTYLWDKNIMREIPIRLQVSDHLPENLSYRVPDLPAVLVKGPAFLVNQLSEIATEPLLLDAQAPATVTFEEVKLQLAPQFRPIELEQQTIPLLAVEIVDQAKIHSRLIKDLKLHYLTNPDSNLAIQGAAALPRTVSIYVTGPAGVLETLDTHSLLALCDLTSYSMQGSQDVPVQIHNLPPKVTVTRILPAEAVRVVLAAPKSP